MMEGIVITPYREEFQAQVATLVTSIQQEFGVPVTYEDQPDLRNIPGVYQQYSGNFWVALDGNTVIGTIALIDRGHHTGVLRKMFVHPKYRGADKGIGKALLDTLLNWSKAHAIHDIFLGTNDLLAGARRFYEKNGFQLVDDETMPPHVAAIRMKVDNRHYHKELAA